MTDTTEKSGIDRPVVMRAIAVLGTVYSVAACIVLGLTTVFRPTAGLLALAQVVSLHLVIASVVLVPIAIASRERPLILALAVLGILGALRFGFELVSLPSAVSGEAIRVANWNLEYGARSPERTVDALRGIDVDIVALEELTTADAAAITADPVLEQAFPYRLLIPDRTVFGIGILSRYPVTKRAASRDPADVEAVVETAPGRVIQLLAAHPLPAAIRTISPLRLPLAYDPGSRDSAIARVRSRIDALRGAAPLLVVGDFNVAPTEPAYDILSRDLRDAHVEAGQGTGWTWRPSRLESLGFGLLRIDYVFTSHDLTPTATDVRCPPAGDHCILRATVAFAEATGTSR